MARPALLRRRVVLAATGMLVLAVLLLSPSFGRATPDHSYRPDLPPDALTNGCYPLPGDAVLDLPYQVRKDHDVAGDDGPRREVRGQYDVVDRDRAEAALVDSFQAVGFVRARATSDGRVVLRRGDEVVRISVAELPDTSAATVVRGEFVLDLPVVALARPEDPVCDRPSSTKRWREPTVSPWLGSLW